MFWTFSSNSGDNSVLSAVFICLKFFFCLWLFYGVFTGTGLFATGLIEPLGPERARMHFRALVAPGQRHTPELAAGVLQAFREITEVEDAGMTRRLQASVRSGAFAVGPMTAAHEAPIARFHDAYLEVFEG